MKQKTIKRLRGAGCKIPKLKKRDRGAEFDAAGKSTGEWPEETLLPARKPLPIVSTIDMLREDDLRYKERKAVMIQQSGITEKMEFVDYIRTLTEDGLDLILFAWGVLKTEGGTYMGIELEFKDKIWATEFLADRAFGKAQQNIKIDSTTHNASDEELLKEVRLLQEKLGKKVLDVEFKKEAISTGSGKEMESGAAEQARAADDFSGIRDMAGTDKKEAGTPDTGMANKVSEDTEGVRQ